MKSLILFTFLLNTCFLFSQEKKELYVFPGQGSDERLFSKLNLEEDFEVKHIVYPMPDKKETMQSFAQKLIVQIDTTSHYSFLGTSIGGMLAVELTDVLSPEKTVIISSAKTKSELPGRYRFMSKVPVYKMFTGRGLKTGARIMQPIVEPDRNVEKETFKSMLRSKHPKYMKRTIAMIVEWEREEFSERIVHIHGDDDNTIPMKNVHADYIVEMGSHMITLTRSEEISQLISEILN